MAETPAQTASADIKRLNRRENHRKDRIRQRADEILAADMPAIYELYATDPRAAIARYNRLQAEAYPRAAAEIPPVQLSTEDRQILGRATHLRGTDRNWLQGGRDSFYGQLRDSATELEQEIEKGKALVAWFTDSIPSIAEFTGEEGKVAFIDADVFKSGNAQSKKSDVYGGVVRSFNFFIHRWEARIADYEDELSIYEDDPLGDVIHVALSLGLEQTFTDVEDGQLWFTLPGREQPYYISLQHRVNLNPKVSDKIDILPERQRHDDWKAAWGNDLTRTIISWGQADRQPYERICRDYFGMYDGNVRPWLAKAIERGSAAPDWFPTELVTRK